jgi:hypothetical protein
MSRPDQVELCCSSIEDVTPVDGGPYGRQLRVGLSMTAAQVRAAICDLLGGMPQPEAQALLRGEFPELFEVTA